MKDLKNFVLITLVAIFSLATTSFTMANDDDLIIKIECQDGTADLMIYLANLVDQPTYVALRDAEGRNIYAESIERKSAFAKKLNMSELKDGKYTLYVEHETMEVTQPILVENNIVNILLSERKEVKSPTIEVTDDFVKFRLAPTALAKKVTVTILNGAETIFEKNEILTSAIQKQYDLSNLYPDKYTFKLVVDGKSYYKNLNLR